MSTAPQTRQEVTLTPASRSPAMASPSAMSTSSSDTFITRSMPPPSASASQSPGATSRGDPSKLLTTDEPASVAEGGSWRTGSHTDSPASRVNGPTQDFSTTCVGHPPGATDPIDCTPQPGAARETPAAAKAGSCMEPLVITGVMTYTPSLEWNALAGTRSHLGMANCSLSKK